MTLREFLQQHPGKELYHYTDAAGLMGILRTKKIWATHAMHLNDAREIVEGAELLREFAKKQGKGNLVLGGRVDDWVQSIHEDTYVACFSADGNQLGQWRAYCPLGDGFSIGIDADHLLSVARKAESHLVQCTYMLDRKKELMKLFADFEIGRRANERDDEVVDRFFYASYRGGQPLVASFKHSAFVQEQEWRLVASTAQGKKSEFRHGRFGVVPYIPISLEFNGDFGIKQIFVGPNQNTVAAERAVAQLCRECGIPKPEIKDSQIPYRH